MKALGVDAYSRNNADTSHTAIIILTHYFGFVLFLVEDPTTFFFTLISPPLSVCFSRSLFAHHYLLPLLFHLLFQARDFDTKTKLYSLLLYFPPSILLSPLPSLHVISLSICPSLISSLLPSLPPLTTPCDQFLPCILQQPLRRCWSTAATLLPSLFPWARSHTHCRRLRGLEMGQGRGNSTRSVI